MIIYIDIIYIYIYISKLSQNRATWLCVSSMVKMAGRNNFPSVTGLTTREFHAATQTNVAAMQWAKLHGLLAANQVCATCNRPMVWSQAGPGKIDEFRWRCGRPCNKTLSIRSRSFFEGSHLNIRSVLDVIRYWAFEEFSFRKASRELAMAEHTFVDWRNFLRDICTEHFLRNPVRIGGVGVEVQIDECVRPQKTRRTTTSAAAVGVRWHRYHHQGRVPGCCSTEECCHSPAQHTAVHPAWNDCCIRPLGCI